MNFKKMPDKEIINKINYWKESFQRSWYGFRKNILSLVGLGVVISVMLIAILSPFIVPYPEDVGSAVHFERAFQPPSWKYPFGTDHVGRDILSRVLYGSRISLILGVVVLSLAVGIGVPLGLIAGYWGATVNALIMRVTDIFLTIPPLVLALTVSSVLARNLTNAMMAISLVWWPWYTRLVQGQVLSIREELFVEAARSTGAGRFRIIFKDILPNCVTTILVKATIDMGFAILTGSYLSFLGLGARPPTPEWGCMVSEGRAYFPGFWWISTLPGLMVFITVLGFTLLGDGLRDFLEVEV